MVLSSPRKYDRPDYPVGRAPWALIIRAEPFVLGQASSCLQLSIGTIGADVKGKDPGNAVLATKSLPQRDPSTGWAIPLASPLTALRTELAALRSELPPALRTELEQLGKRATPDELCDAVVTACRWRPLSLPELAALTGKTAAHLRTRVLRRMLADGRVRYLYPDEPNHPHQKYAAGKGAP